MANGPEGTITDSLAADGYAIIPGFLSSEQRLHLIDIVNDPDVTNIRNLLRVNTAVREFAGSPAVMTLACNILGEKARAVKATLFDKTPDMNWKVPPHQDVTIVVKDKIEAAGFEPWTVKGGFHNVQPPAAVLERMLSLRFHLDDCDEDNGALKVWPGSHLHGKLGDEKVQDWIDRNPAVICPVSAGGVLLMRPLIIHASAVASSPLHRRVIHIDYAGGDLPHGLLWLDEITSD